MWRLKCFGPRINSRLPAFDQPGTRCWRVISRKGDFPTGELSQRGMYLLECPREKLQLDHCDNDARQMRQRTYSSPGNVSSCTSTKSLHHLRSQLEVFLRASGEPHGAVYRSPDVRSDLAFGVHAFWLGVNGDRQFTRRWASNSARALRPHGRGGNDSLLCCNRRSLTIRCPKGQ
jgi:hypothetical protein